MGTEVIKDPLIHLRYIGSVSELQDRHFLGEILQQYTTLQHCTELNFEAPLTCRWEGTRPPVLGVSWPWGYCGRSCLHRNMPLLWLWAGGPSVSPAAGQSSALQHCSRFCLKQTRRTNANTVCYSCNMSLSLLFHVHSFGFCVSFIISLSHCSQALTTCQVLSRK